MWVYRKSLGFSAVVDPHLAKNERDVGHPSLVATGCSFGPEQSAVDSTPLALSKNRFPQGLKPDLVRNLTYGLKPVPFRRFSS
jgi:hypothetical protein